LLRGEFCFKDKISVIVLLHAQVKVDAVVDESSPHLKNENMGYTNSH